MMEQLDMFDDLGVDKEWEMEWRGMPEYNCSNNNPYIKIVINFKTKEDYKNFSHLIGQNLTENTDSIWFPKQFIPRGVYKDE
jgi:hypothetical protein